MKAADRKAVERVVALLKRLRFTGAATISVGVKNGTVVRIEASK